MKSILFFLILSFSAIAWSNESEESLTPQSQDCQEEQCAHRGLASEPEVAEKNTRSFGLKGPVDFEELERSRQEHLEYGL